MFIFKHDKDICAICLEEKKLPIVLICGHSFCEECILMYMTYTEIRSKCPLCRTTLARKNKRIWWYFKHFTCLLLSAISLSLVLHMYCYYFP